MLFDHVAFLSLFHYFMAQVKLPKTLQIQSFFLYFTPLAVFYHSNCDCGLYYRWHEVMSEADEVTKKHIAVNFWYVGESIRTILVLLNKLCNSVDFFVFTGMSISFPKNFHALRVAYL